VGWFRGTPVYNLGNPNSDHRTGAERRHTPTTGEGFSEMPNRDKRGWESGNWATTREYTALASEKGLKKSRLVGGSTTHTPYGELCSPSALDELIHTHTRKSKPRRKSRAPSYVGAYTVGLKRGWRILNAWRLHR